MKDPAYESMSKAKRQNESGNPKGAMDTLEAYLRTDPYNTKARLLLANVAIYSMDDLKFGLMQLDAILDLDPDNVDALKASVTVLMKYKNYNRETAGKYERLVLLSPDAELYNAYGIFLKMQMLDFEKAAEYYEKAIALNPNKYEYHQNYAVILLNEIHDYEKAKTELERVLELNPGNASATKNYALLMKRKFDADGNLRKKRFSVARK